MDYVGPDVEPDDVREAVRLRRKAIFWGWPRALSHAVRSHPSKLVDGELSDSTGEKMGGTMETTECEVQSTQNKSRSQMGKFVSFSDDATTVVPTEGMRSPTSTEILGQSRVNSPEPVVNAIDTIWNPSRVLSGIPQLQDSDEPPATTLSNAPTPVKRMSPDLSRHHRRRRNILAHIRTFFKSLLTPASIAIMVSFPIALVPQLKALFVEVPGVHIHPAPDGQPPLAFLMDAANFIGAASVPLGLICLGSALARLNVPRNQWKTLPLGAISWLAIGKIIIMPVLGVLIVEGLVNTGFIPREDKVLRFVCM